MRRGGLEGLAVVVVLGVRKDVGFVVYNFLFFLRLHASNILGGKEWNVQPKEKESGMISKDISTYLEDSKN